MWGGGYPKPDTMLFKAMIDIDIDICICLQGGRYDVDLLGDLWDGLAFTGRVVLKLKRLHQLPAWYHTIREVLESLQIHHQHIHRASQTHS